MKNVKHVAFQTCCEKTPVNKSSRISAFTPSCPFSIKYMYTTNDSLNDYLDHSIIIAHIVNGIALQHGLMNGSIPVNDVIGELLHLGSVDVPTVANFKKDGITALSGKLTDIKSKPVTNDVTEVEDQTLAWNDLIVKSMTVKSWNASANEFFDDVQKFSVNFNFSSLTSVTVSLSTADQQLKAISAYPDVTTPIQQDMAYRSFKYLHDSVVAAITQADTFNSAVLALKQQYPLLKNVNTVFEPIETVLKLTKTRIDLPLDRDTNKINATRDNLQQVVDSIEDAKSSLEDTSTLQKVATSISNPISSKTSFTHGFPNGFADIEVLKKKDVENPWIAEITNTERSSMDKLDNGLQPLFDVSKQLAPLEEQLVSISSVSVIDAVESLSQVYQEISGLNSDSAEKLGNLIDEIYSCRESAKTFDKFRFREAEDLVEQAKKLGSVAEIKPIQVDGDKLKNELNDFMKSLAFSNFQNETTSIPEVKAVLEKLKSTGGLDKITNTLNTFQKAFDTFPTTGLKEAADAIMKSKDKRDFPFLVDEMSLHSCLQKLKDDSVMISETIQAMREVRKVDTEKLVKVQSAATTLSEVAGELSDVGSIRDTMNKDVTEATTNVNKLPDSLTKSKVIGQSINSLRSAFLLRDLKKQVEQLKTIDSTVQVEIHKISDPTVKTAIQQQWGDHNKEMIELYETLGKVESFEKNLNVSNLTTIGAYGTPLTALATLTSVTMNAKEKSKALGALLSDGSLQMNPTVKKTIEDGQKTLDQLADLDLGFASHSSQFQSAPGVFNALHDFLTKLLQIPMSPTQPSAQIPVTQGGSVGASPIQLPLIIGITFGSLFVAGGMVAGGFFGYKKWDARNQLLKLVEWIMKHCFKNLANVKDVHCGYMQVMNANAELWRKKTTLAEDKKRFPTQSCNPDTALLVPNGKDEVMVFANKVTTLGGLPFIATHAPKDAAEFWKMTLSQNPEFIVSLCGDEEMKTLNCDYYPKKGEKPKKFGDFTVALTSEEMTPNDVNKRSLTVTCGEKSLQLTHLQAVKWPVNDIPDDHETAFELMKLVNKSKSPVIVHCSDGNDATMSFIGLQFIFEEVRSHPRLNFGHFMHEMCERTWHPIEKYTFSAWTVLGVRKHLYDECKLPDEHKVDYDHDLKLLKDLKKEWIKEDEKKKEEDEKKKEEDEKKKEEDEKRKEEEKVRIENEKKRQDAEDERVQKDEAEKAQLNKDLADLKRDKELQEEYLEIIKKDNSELRNDKMIRNRRDARQRERIIAENRKLTIAEAERNNNRFEWVVKNYSEKVELHYKFHTGVLMRYLQSMKPDTKKAKECLPERKHGFSKKYCNPDTAVLAMQDGVKIPIHANYVSSDTPDGTKFIATQAPTKHDEDCDDTTADFWVMTLYHDTKFIVSLCTEEEMKQLAQYYHPDPKQSVTCGRYTIETVSVDLVFNEEVKKRTLKVTDTEKEMSKTVYHFQFLKWVDQKIPNGHNAAIEVMEVVNKHKVRTEVWTLANSLFQFQRHVVVHCKAGVGRTMSFIGLQFVYEEIYNNPKLVTVMEPMRKMRELRWDAVQSVEQSFWIYLGVVLRLVRKLNLSAHYYDNQFKLMPEFSRMYNGANEKVKKGKDKNKTEEREKGGSDVVESVSDLSDYSSSEKESDSGDETDD
ncbi:hypothetical protein CRE_26725 [Caenorhabditis remanei]|uniref:Tyrosine-protein phosphatase domain-containing protein n=1 Tax=Caenorhabditis remanei TaxID=31234 RepID=E3MXW0_CAERE|nr:hypothetical protein CRE_26725 [Caenorhabditis remanei]